ncbi:zinc carboxypeptidase A 1 precursor [Metarhizium album ARSEF 1941]|uniref:Zinc carboxypeptidase A 1 n=1 Tax=Metarhizium album (strain ARSEF 1941) TaxID=1081103 RepID=A0A0B2WKI8_METAS|nr:zinc carboxypeptidase A 1 precursor [Metarhizium album ARSEF 1941]KHN94448.1 zinc carboxypeptidase A 1 precursor [Metarhizium album ARSEF 1941]
MKLQTALWFAALGHVANGCLLPEEMGDGDSKPVGLERRQRGGDYVPIGKGDRFEHKVPWGLGSDPQAFKDASQLSILSLAEIESALKRLEKAYPGKMTLTEAEKKTFENRPIYYAVVGSQSPAVFLTSGIHPRERGGPDAMVYLIADLLWADKKNAGLRYGSREYSVQQVRRVLSAGIAVIPAVNPDGIHHDQTTNSCWRKNRRSFGKHGVGVDINRNFNVLWDYERIFSPSAGVRSRMSKTPWAPSYIGPSPFSEPETQSVNIVFERVRSLRWYLDLHSYLGQVLYGWGDDYTQTTDPGMSFRNRKYDGQRGLKGDMYKEYMEPEDFDAQKAASKRMVRAMNREANEDRYMAAEIMDLYPALGSTDEALAKYYSHSCGSNRINALTFEFGKNKTYTGNCQEYFYPKRTEYKDDLTYIMVGLMEFLLNAAEEQAKVKTWSQGCDASSQQPTPKPEQQGSGKDTPELQKCSDQYRAAVKRCRDEDEPCIARIRHEAYQCIQRANQYCLQKYSPTWRKCQNFACRHDVRKNFQDCERQQGTKREREQDLVPGIKGHALCVKRRRKVYDDCTAGGGGSKCNEKAVDGYVLCELQIPV